MKKPIKILLWILGTLAVLLILMAVLISPVAKNYIEKHSKELTGRIITMDKLRINIFTGGLKVEGFVMCEADDSARFVSFETFETQMRLLPLIKNEFIIGHILLSGADIRVSQNGDKFNFDDLIAHFAGDTTTAPQPVSPSSWSVGIYNISIRETRVLYKDLAVGSDWDLEDMTLDIPGVYFSDKSTDVGLDLRFQNGGTLKSTLRYDMEQSKYDLAISLKEFTIGGLLPYCRQTMNVSNLEGLLTADVNVKGDMDHVMDFDLSGTATVSNVLLQDGKNRDVIKLASASVDIARINLAQSLCAINKLAVDGAVSGFELYADGKNNFSDLMKSDAPETTLMETADASLPTDTTAAAPASAPMLITIGELQVAGSSVTYTDNSLAQPFRYTVSDIRLSALNFNPDAKNDVTINAVMQQKGSAHMRWIGSASDMGNQNLTLTLRNIDLKDFNPYSLQYFGYPITHGNLSFVSQNRIVSNQLDGTNKLDMFNPKVDKRSKEIKPEFKVPLKLGLYVLTDKHGRAYLDIPVKGDINSPEFSYKKIVIKTLVNLLVKVATAPATFLADAMGMGGKQLNQVEITPWQREFSAEQYTKFGELADIVKNKPELKLGLTQQFDYNAALDEQSLSNLKRAWYVKRNGKEGTPLELIDRDAFLSVDTKSPAVVAFADSLLRVKGAPVTGKIGDKARTLYSQQANEEVMQRILARNVLLQSYMTTKLSLPDSCLRISAMPVDSMKMYKGKSVFAVNLTLPGEAPASPDIAPNEE